MFDRKRIPNKYFKARNDSGFLIIDMFCKLLCLLRVPFEILYNLLLPFSYCTMIVSLFPIFLSLYVCLDHLLLRNSLNPVFSKFLFISTRIFLEINTIPNKISCSTKYCFSLLKHFPKFKNALFYIIVLQILLIISGVEVNTGPALSKNTKSSFAVWNLDSIPGRDTQEFR